MIGAVYCVYEDSGFLAESIRRLYPVMNHILILIGMNPWNGTRSDRILQQTWGRARHLYDPDRKIEIVTRDWMTEADERNYGLWSLNNRGIDWCFICDEDELYNTSEISNVSRILDETKFSVYLFKHQLYWKNRDTVLAGPDCFFPTILCTKPNRLTFTEARMVTVFEGRKWETLSPSMAVCHHMSYVRTDEQMLRKIQSFTHVDDIVKGWYEAKWLAWKPGDTDLHPVHPSSFTGTLSASEAPYKLETCP